MHLLKFVVLFYVSIWLLSFSTPCNAQEFTDSADFSNYTPISYFSVFSQNDLYQRGNSGDKYFSNGVHFELAHQKLSKWPTRYLLPKLSKSAFNEYAITLSQDIHTPFYISRLSLDTNDRPYCGLLYTTLSNHSNNFRAGRKLKSKFILGFIGPASAAEQTQNWVHKNISHSISADGWTHQINNGLILEYEVALEQRLPFPSKYVELTVSAVGHIGTIYNFIQAESNLKIGLFNTSFLNRGGKYNNNGSLQKTYRITKIRKKRKSKSPTIYTNRTLQVYGFAHINLGYQFYDGTVQGSLIPFAESPYTFDAERLDHRHNLYRAGIVVNYKAFQIQYAYVKTPDTYKNEGLYGWGEITLLYSF